MSEKSCFKRSNGLTANNEQVNKMRLQKTPEASPIVASCDETSGWKVRASDGALNTSNPIREIIETMNLAENPEKKVIPLSIGDPTIFGNLKPCAEILDAIQNANASGKYYGYQTAAGMEVARKAVADYFHKCTGTRVRPQVSYIINLASREMLKSIEKKKNFNPDEFHSTLRQDVVLASGCSHAIDLCICVLARHGQNILIPRPGFPLYKTLTSVYGVRYKQYNLIAERNWSIDLKNLESLIDEDTAAIVINNPSNPCGSVFSERHLKQILRVAEKHRIPIISDEIYDKFVFSPDVYEKETPDSSPVHMVDQNRKGHQQLGNNENGVLNGRHSILSKTLSTVDTNSYCNNWPADKLNGYMESGCDHDDDDDDCEVGCDSNDNDFRYVPFISLASLSETVPILTCGGISKTCLIPGLRLGWVIINDKQNIFDKSVRNGLGRLTQRLMGPNSLVQGALQDILTNVPDHFYKKTMDFIFQNAKLCYERLLSVKGLQPYMPQGSMYLMVRFDPKMFPTIDGDLDFTSKLMNEESVLVLPGKCFDFPNFFRVCLTVPTNVMEEALGRIGEFCERHAISTLNFSCESAIVKVSEINELKKNHHLSRVGILNGKSQILRSNHSAYPLVQPQVSK